MLDTHGRKAVQPAILAIGTRMAKWDIHPNWITLAAFLLGISAAVAIIAGNALLGVLLLWSSGLLDALDGTVARLLKKTSAFGTLLDLVLDRAVEMAFILAVVHVSPNATWSCLVLMMTILLSMTVFLSVGAIAANTGEKTFRYQTGIMERTEGFIGLSAMALLSDQAANIALLMAMLIFITAIQRMIEAKELLRGK